MLRPSFAGRALVVTTPRKSGPGLHGHTHRHPVEPVANCHPLVQTICMSKEHEEGGLEGILGVVGTPQEATADAENSGPMSVNKLGKREFVALLVKARKQLAICLLRRSKSRDTGRERIRHGRFSNLQELHPTDSARSRRRQSRKKISVLPNCVSSGLFRRRSYLDSAPQLHAVLDCDTRSGAPRLISAHELSLSGGWATVGSNSFVANNTEPALGFPSGGSLLSGSVARALDVAQRRN